MSKKKSPRAGEAKVLPSRILFIGNSFTQRNNLPGLLAEMAEMAAELGMTVAHELISVVIIKVFTKRVFIQMSLEEKNESKRSLRLLKP